MKQIVLISCASKKLKNKAKAEDIYISSLFRKSLQYAKSLQPDDIYILSAKFGLLKLNEIIEPYNQTLNTMPVDEIRKWSERVLQQLSNISNLQKDNYIFLAGDNYRKFLIPSIVNYQIPMKGLKIGKQLQWLTNSL